MSQSITVYYLDSNGTIHPIDVTNEQHTKIFSNLCISSTELDMPDINPFQNHACQLHAGRNLFESERAAVATHQKHMAMHVSYMLNQKATEGDIGEWVIEKLGQLHNTTVVYSFERMLGYYEVSRVEIPTVLLTYLSNTNLMYRIGYKSQLYVSYQSVTDAIVEDYLINNQKARELDIPPNVLRTFNTWEAV